MTIPPTPEGPAEDQAPFGRRAPKRAADLPGVERPTRATPARPSSPLGDTAAPGGQPGAPRQSAQPARKSLADRARGAAQAIGGPGDAGGSGTTGHQSQGNKKPGPSGASPAAPAGSRKPGAPDPGAPRQSQDPLSNKPSPFAPAGVSTPLAKDAAKNMAKGAPGDGPPKNLRGRAADAGAAAVTKAGAAALSSATGIPPVVSEKIVGKGVEKVRKHWKVLLAVVVLGATLPLVALVSIFATLVSNSNPSSIACQASQSATALTGAHLPPPNELSLFMAAERWAESRNNYNDRSGGATWDASYLPANGLSPGFYGAFGAYQYIQPTWYSEATRAGEGAYANVNPSTLPSGVSQKVQDAVATYEFSINYKDDKGNPVDTGNTWMWVAEQHFDSLYAVPGSQNVAPGNNGGETMAEYGNMVVGYMTSQPWLSNGATATANNAIELATGQCGATEIAGPLAAKIVEIAKAELGKTQAQAPSANAWGPPGQQWCADFASWVMKTAGVQPDPGSIPYSGDIWKWIGENHGVQLEPSATPQPGDMVLFGPGYGSSVHVAIVASVLANGDITTIGGNEGTYDSRTSSVQISLPFNPALAGSQFGESIWAYAQPPGA